MGCGCNGSSGGNGNGYMGSPTVPPSSQWLPSTGMAAPNSPQPLGGTTQQTFQAERTTAVAAPVSDRSLTWLAIIISVVGLFVGGRR